MKSIVVGRLNEESGEGTLLRVIFYLFILSSVLSFTLEVQSSASWNGLFFGLKIAMLFLYVLGSLVCSEHLEKYLLIGFLFGFFALFASDKVLPYMLFVMISLALSDRSHGFLERMFCRAAVLVLCGCLAVFALSFLGIIDSKVFVNTLGYAQEERNSLGFFNPNPASLLLLSVMTIFFVYGRYWYFYISLIVFFVFSIWLFSRTYLLVACLFPFILLLGRLRLSVFFNIFSVCSILIVPIFALGFAEYRTITVAGVDLNAYLSNRLYVISESFSSGGGVALFPNSGFVTVDPGLMNMLGGGGLLLYLLFSAVLISAISYRPGYRLSLLVLIFVLINLSENIFSPYNLLSLAFLAFVIKKFSWCVDDEKNYDTELFIGVRRN